MPLGQRAMLRFRRGGVNASGALSAVTRPGRSWASGRKLGLGEEAGPRGGSWAWGGSWASGRKLGLGEEAGPREEAEHLVTVLNTVTVILLYVFPGDCCCMEGRGRATPALNPR